MKTKIFLASDHAGFQYKEAIKNHLEGKYQLVDLGTYSPEQANYASFGMKLGKDVSKDSKCFGIAICGSGIGMSIAANRYKHVRAARVVNIEDAKLARHHNDANVIALGERVISEKEAIAMVDAFLSTPFDGGRHLERIETLDK